MGNEQLGRLFAESFAQASQHNPAVYSYSIRIMTAVLCIITSVMVVNYFVSKAAKDSDTYIPRFVGLSVKLMAVLGLVLIYLL